MGTIRLLLALAVVFGHAPGWQQIQSNAADPLRPIAPYFAVQAFFIISGFYMEMVRDRYEPAGLWVFWSNRYSRLIAPYLIVALITVLLAIAFPEHAPPFQSYTPKGVIEGLLLGLANLSILGTDIVAFLGLEPLAGLVIPQSWSLGTELWFYLLVPMYWRTPTRYVLAIILVSCAFRIGIAVSSLPAFPWQQRFFPSELAFFLVGMLSYRHRKISAIISPAIALPAAILGILFSGWIGTSESVVFSAALAVLSFLFLPGIWKMTCAVRFDRTIGELSYPVYLVHITVGYFVLPAQSMWGGGMLALLSIVAAVPLYVVIDRPLDRWREHRRSANETTMADTAALAMTRQ
jgi:peptidoglycan/LPS O-acetylase OafA/YrhL